MNILRKSIAPITDLAWAEITLEANRIFKLYLTARKFADIEGPVGLDHGGVSTGRLQTPGKQSKTGINYGIREIIPFVEIRKPFELDLWELDNVERGTKDIHLDPLVEAAKEMALFEENAIYSGFGPGHITGLDNSATSKKVAFPDDPNEFLKVIGALKISLQKEGVEGPYAMVINDQKWQDLINLAKGYPVLKQLQQIIEGQIIISHSNANSYLLSERGVDFELCLGQDISIGYDGHTSDKVKLFLTESFTFRVLSPGAVWIFSKK